ncbi:uncharacterized protein UV8b_04557 [Ustilaginoidea virens]|uniref:RNA helicase n=1 Tax=Ustilaginoidea virens TaxID=1159556 RepID=A0A063C425_USTVR|nr:uncharacterized protein UV8b_04557 [Ustilaginoidea virens]QUC20316.1 hypothetical protein UV8b_04557 [Ustilaginoidea virens]GAO14753.1 hypothetical protein UVI_02028360 [Ustilaginoidea virens]
MAPENQVPNPPKRRKVEPGPVASSPPVKHGQRRGDQDAAALLKSRRQLPIWQYRSEIQTFLRSPETDVLVLVGETGSGKSTQVPQFLYQEPWCRPRRVKAPGRAHDEESMSVGGNVAITQPRRIAATTLAHRVAQEVGTPLDRGASRGLVGYSVRFDRRVPKGCRIKFLTEGTLLQELLGDPYLRQYSAVIVDEIHQRSVDVDLVVGFLKQILSDGGKMRGGVPLKVVIMSATAEIDAIRSFFNTGPPRPGPGSDRVQVLHVKGRQFPVEIVHEPKPVADIQDAIVKTIFRIHVQEPLPGDILAFFVGQEQIEAAQNLIEEYAATLASNVPKVQVLPLYGQLSAEGQHKVFLPVSAKLTRKIVLATNIAETSVTVPGVRYVIDCGKAKIKQYLPTLSMETLLAKPISKSSAIQRAGRAGREGPGKCFRLYTQGSFDTLQTADLAEILRTDVVSAVLTMKARGIADVLAFPLIDPPKLEAMEKASFQLHLYRAIDDDGSITPAGRKMARLPVPAALGAVLLAAASREYDCILEVIDIISCITCGEDVFLQVRSEEEQQEVQEARRQLQRREGDLLTYLATMQQYAAENADRIQWCKKRRMNVRNMKQAMHIRRQLRRVCLEEELLRDAPEPDPQPFTPASPERAETILKCFLRGYCYKTAFLVENGSYECVEGVGGRRAIAIHPASVLHGQKKEAIMFLDHVYTTKNYAKRVSAIRGEWIVEAAKVAEAD